MVNGREGLNRLHFHNHGLLYDQVNLERGLNRHSAVHDMNWSLRLDTKRTRPQFYNQASVVNRFKQAGSQCVVYGNRACDDLFRELLEAPGFSHAVNSARPSPSRNGRKNTSTHNSCRSFSYLQLDSRTQGLLRLSFQHGGQEGTEILLRDCSDALERRPEVPGAGVAGQARARIQAAIRFYALLVSLLSPDLARAPRGSSASEHAETSGSVRSVSRVGRTRRTGQRPTSILSLRSGSC